MRINDNPPTLKEIKDAIAALLNYKAVGVDGLPAKLFKAQPAVADMLHPLIKPSGISETFPDKENEGFIVKTPKKGDLRNCNN